MRLHRMAGRVRATDAQLRAATDGPATTSPAFERVAAKPSRARAMRWPGRSGGRLPVAAMLVAAGLALGACDYVAEKKLVPGMHTEADVRTLMGVPDMIWEEENGAKKFEYPRGPVGKQTYFVYIAPDGKYKSMEKALNEENFAKLKPGMSRDDARRILGKQTEVTPYPLKNEEVWSWRYEEEGNRTMFFNAHFDPARGRIVRTTRNEDWKTMGN